MGGLFDLTERLIVTGGDGGVPYSNPAIAAVQAGMLMVGGAPPVIYAPPRRPT